MPSPTSSPSRGVRNAADISEYEHAKNIVTQPLSNSGLRRSIAAVPGPRSLSIVGAGDMVGSFMADRSLK